MNIIRSFRSLRLLVAVAAVATCLAAASSGARSQALPALWEIEQAGEVYAALRTNTAVASRPSFVDDENLLDPGEFGCVIGGAIGAVVLFADPSILSLFVDGIVTAGWPAALYAGWGGLILASVCTVGQVMSPLVAYVYHRYISPPETFTARNTRS